MLRLTRANEGRPIWAVPYRELAPLRPVEIAEGTVLHRIPAGDARNDHIPRVMRLAVKLDREGKALRSDHPDERASEAFAQSSDWILLAGAFLLSDGRPACVYGAVPDPLQQRGREHHGAPGLRHHGPGRR